MYTVRIHNEKGIIEKKAAAGDNLLKILREAPIEVNTPCGGKGTCGKCRFKVKGLKAEPSEREKELLGETALQAGLRLACCNRVDSDLDIYPQRAAGEANIMISARERSVKLNPIVKKSYMELAGPDIHDQASDLERLSAASGVEAEGSVTFLRKLPGVLREGGFKTTIVRIGNELAGAEPGNTGDRLYGVAVDIGTTTIAAYLYDLVNGKRTGVCSLLNPQRKFGADVLSRIEYTLSSKAAEDEMNAAIIDAVNGIISHFAGENGIDGKDIYAIVFVGNTTMMHFLMKLPAANIAVSPFIPVTTGLHIFNASQLGLRINPSGCAVIFPGVSGYIGADTVAAVLSSGMYEDAAISLLIDIGTNGEIVLGGREWLYSCSTAAGPAFEGANIRNGVGGITGAIDSISFSDGISFTTIGNEKAVGICGSGIIDMIAGMLSAGIIDETGRIPDREEAEGLPLHYRNMLRKIDGLNSLLLVPSGECAAGSDIAITQKDVRELQNAKAAIAAGVRTLASRAGIKLEAIDKVYLAGGFGSYINIESALKIGLIPSELKGRIESIGNAAGAGAVEGLLSRDMLREAENIKKRIKYIELSASPDFTENYVESMLFE